MKCVRTALYARITQSINPPSFDSYTYPKPLFQFPSWHFASARDAADMSTPGLFSDKQRLGRRHLTVA